MPEKYYVAYKDSFCRADCRPFYVGLMCLNLIEAVCREHTNDKHTLVIVEEWEDGKLVRTLGEPDPDHPTTPDDEGTENV